MAYQNLSQAQLLEKYRIALANVQNQPQIASSMAEFGYDTKKIAEGKNLLNTTREVYNQNIIENEEEIEAYDTFKTIRDTMVEKHALHRKKAKVVFRKQPIILLMMGINGRQEKTYIKWVENMKLFYGKISAAEEIQEGMARLKVTADEVKDAHKNISLMEKARAAYLKEKGENQDATKQKDQAFAVMDDWMSDFFSVARIALDDHPQLMESLNQLVRS